MNQPYPHWTRVFIRKTHKYVPDCAHLDDWGCAPAEMRYLSIADHGDDEGVLHIMRVKFRPIPSEGGRKEDITPDFVRQVMRDSLSRGCSCEHDCCGCWHGGLRSVHAPDNRKSGEFIVTATFSRCY